MNAPALFGIDPAAASRPATFTRHCWVLVLVALCVESATTASVKTPSHQTEQLDTSTSTTNTKVITPRQHRHRHRHHYQNPTPSAIRRDSPTTCPQGQFLRVLPRGESVCTPCSDCPVGFGVHRRCTARSDTVCRACVRGHGYLREYFGARKCFQCRKCENREVLSECTLTSNRVCGHCKPGFFYDDLTEECMACSYCYPEVRNYGIVEPTCVNENQPADYTCLPSLPPRHLRSTTVIPTTPRQTLEDKVHNLDEKLRKLGQLVTSELKEVREQLDTLKAEVSLRRTSL